MPRETIKPGYDRVTDSISYISGYDTVPKDKLEMARDRGQAVHSAIEAIQKDLMVIIKSEWSGYIDSYKKWAEGKRLKPSPNRFYCEDEMITGEIDCYEELEEGIVIYDFKTSYRSSPTWVLQSSAYRYLAQINGFKDVITCEMIHLNKDGKDPIILSYKYDFGLYKHALSIYREFFKNRKPIEWENI